MERAGVRKSGLRSIAVHDGSRKSEEPGYIGNMAPQPFATLCLRNMAMLQLAALSDYICTLGLHPVYGSVPSSLPELRTAITHLTVWLTCAFIYHRRIELTGFIPIIGCFPAITQPIMFKYSGSLGPSWGPLLTSLMTSFPIIYLVFLVNVIDASHAFFRTIEIDRVVKQPYINKGAKVFLLFILVSFFDRVMATCKKVAVYMVAAMKITTTDVMSSRYGLQAMMIILWMSLAPSKRTVYIGILPLLYTVLLVTHLPLDWHMNSINARLSPTYSLLARQESSTGYISVVDNLKDGFRVMRCDHSLLGGEWINKPKDHPSKLNEPIYSIFVMLEAVRLVETESTQANAGSEGADTRALVV